MQKQGLAELRQRARGRGGVQVLVSGGSSGLAVGAKQVFQALKEELARRGVSGVEVSLGGEWGLTAEEPLVVVKEDRRVTLYGNVNEEGARRIASEHLAAGKPVDQWLIELREVSK